LPDQKQDESFRVIDRRLFNPDGEIRDEATRAERRRKETEIPPAPAKNDKPTPAATDVASGVPFDVTSQPAGAREFVGSPGEAQPSQAEPAKASRGLQMLINFVAQNAAMLLGAYPDPRTGQPMLDLEGARELIDMLDALRESTRGNLAAEDDRLLLEVLSSLKLSFMQMTKAAAKTMRDKAKAQS